MKYQFNALLARMKYIDRWSLMNCSRRESLSEHTADTAILVHILALIAKEITGNPVRTEMLAVAALYHDAPEILTGDLPTPVKYQSPRIQAAYKELERESAQTMAGLLPPTLQGEMLGYLTGDCLTEREHQLLKGADRLSALIKCIEEDCTGNREFAAAQAQQQAALEAMHCPEVDYFMENMLPCYTQNLDELTRREE